MSTYPGWSIIPGTMRWSSVWLTTRGYLCLNAFPSGAWSITQKSQATTDNPHGIMASSFHNDALAPDLPEAMRIAEHEARKLGASPLGEYAKYRDKVA